MSDSLRDQLLKAGFAAKPQPEPRAKPAQRPRPQSQQPSAPRNGQRPQRPQRSPSARPASRESSEIDLGKAYALRDKSEREAREREQRAAEERAREKKERRQKMAALLNGKSLNDQNAEVPRHFPHANKIRRVYVTAEQLPQLNGGALSVVQFSGRYLLVARDVGLAAQAIDADALVLLCDPQGVDEDGVPTDLMW